MTSICKDSETSLRSSVKQFAGRSIAVKFLTCWLTMLVVGATAPVRQTTGPWALPSAVLDRLHMQES